MAKNAAWIVEQPHGSLLCRHPRFEWMTNQVAWVSRLHMSRRPHTSRASEVYQSSFWMLLHGANSCKRTVVFSTMKECQELDLGVLTAEKQRLTSSELTRRWPGFRGPSMSRPVISGPYYNKKGVKRFHGTKDLKSSQCLDSRLTG